MRDWSDPVGKSFMRATIVSPSFPLIMGVAVNSGLTMILGYLAGSRMMLSIFSILQRIRLVELSTRSDPDSVPPVGTWIVGKADSRATIPLATTRCSSMTDRDDELDVSSRGGEAVACGQSVVIGTSLTRLVVNPITRSCKDRTSTLNLSYSSFTCFI